MSFLRPNLNVSAAFPDGKNVENCVDNGVNNGVEVEIRKEGEQGVEVQRLQSFGCGIDVLFD